MEVFSYLGLLGGFLFKALLYALAGGVFTGFLDFVSHLWWNGKVTKSQYIAAVGATFLLGTFTQWHDEYTARLLAESGRNSLEKVNDLVKQKEIDIASLEKRLQEKSDQIQDLRQEAIEAKRQSAELRDKLEASSTEYRSAIASKQALLDGLKLKLDDRQRREEIYMNLGVILHNGEALKRKSLAETEVPPPIDDISKWAEETHHWLAKYVGPAQAALFASPPALPSYGFGKPQKHENAWNFVEHHLVVIRSFMNNPELGMTEITAKKR